MAKKVIAGLVILVTGIFILLSNFYVINFNFKFSILWPIVIIALGVGNLLDKKKFDLGTSLLLIIGFYFLMKNYGYINVDLVSLLFPIVLILIGLGIMLPKKENKELTKMETVKNDIMLNAFCSSINNKCSSKEVKKIELSSSLGNVTLDLSDATADKGKCYCYANTVLGGIDIILPDNWSINMDGVTFIFGSINEYDDSEVKDNVLYLNGIVVLGKINIK